MEYSLGIPDEDFIRGKVPMSKQEVRILTLAKARIKTTDTVLDVGSGTGSLTIEASFLADKGIVYALEKNPQAVELLHENIDKFERSNIRVLEGYAPEVMPPQEVMFDAVLIGGSGGKLEELLELLDRQLKVGGRIVINAVTLETLAQCTQISKGWFNDKYSFDTVCIQATRMKQAGNYNLFDALNPVYIFSAVKNNN